MSMLGNTGRSLALVALGALLAGCGPSNTKFPVSGGEAKASRDPYKTVQEVRGSIFDEGGIAYAFSPAVLFGGKDEDRSETDEDENQTQAPPSDAGIQVNGYLWSAALDAVSFMPIETADASAGIIKTGWHTPRGRPHQRIRVNVFILSGELRDDGVKATVFREYQNPAGDWVDIDAVPGSESDLVQVILKRAKELRQPSTT